MKKLSLAQIDHIEKFIKDLKWEAYYRHDVYEYSALEYYASCSIHDRRVAMLRAQEQKQKQ